MSVYPPLMVRRFSCWTRIQLAFCRPFIAVDPATGHVVHLKRLRGRWYFLWESKP